MMSSSPQNAKLTQGQLDTVFKALGDQTRRDILVKLSEGPAMVTELAKPFDMSLPAVGKHLRVLERAGLVTRTINGRVHQCALNALPLRNAGDWISYYQQFWEGSLDGLSAYLRGKSDDE